MRTNIFVSHFPCEIDISDSDLFDRVCEMFPSPPDADGDYLHPIQIDRKIHWIGINVRDKILYIAETRGKAVVRWKPKFVYFNDGFNGYDIRTDFSGFHPDNLSKGIVFTHPEKGTLSICSEISPAKFDDPDKMPPFMRRGL